MISSSQNHDNLVIKMMNWIAAALLLVAGALLWWQRGRGERHARQHLEDALKHLFEQEYRGRRGTLSSLAGILRLSDSAIVALVGRMQSQGLIVADGQGFLLTTD